MFGVLVVEDNEIFRKLVVEMLGEIHSLDVQEAASGEEALDQFEFLRPDLVFVDLKLGDENGFSFIEKVRALDKEVIIAILTSFDLPEYRNLMKKLDIDYFLVKGVSTQKDILNVVNSILAKPAEKKEAVY